MTWDDYYEKVNDWEVSTAVKEMSLLEDMGSPDEVTEVLIVIGFVDKQGATRLLNKALQSGVKFSGENLCEFKGMCSEESFMNAFYQSADAFMPQDLEVLSYCMDNKFIVDVAKKYKIQAPGDIESEYEEDFGIDVSTPISWAKFYDVYNSWESDYAIVRSRAISDFGDEDEVIEVLNGLFYTNRYEGSAFIQRALNYGVMFNVANLMEISALCDEQTTKQAIVKSAPRMSDDDLEELYGNVDDEIIAEVAQRQNLQLPEDMREEAENEALDMADFVYGVNAAINAANYALNCLVRAQAAMNTSRNASFMDMVSDNLFPSVFKYTALNDAERELNIAQNALERMNFELRNILQNSAIHLKTVKLSSVIDVWFDSRFMDCLANMQINQVQKKIRRAISQVEEIKRELMRYRSEFLHG